MLKHIAVAVSAACLVVLAASAAYATPVALGGTNTRGTSSGGHMHHGMSHMMMKHHMMMRHHMSKGRMPGSKNL